MERIYELLGAISEESTTEELRRVIADVRDLIDEVNSDIEGFKETVAELSGKVEERDAEIDRLKEENGKLFRERVARYDESINAKVNETEKSVEEEIAELEANINI